MIQVTLMEGVDSMDDFDSLGNPDAAKEKTTTFLATGIGHSPDGFVTFVTEDGTLRVGGWRLCIDFMVFAFEGSFYRYIKENSL